MDILTNKDDNVLVNTNSNAVYSVPAHYLVGLKTQDTVYSYSGITVLGRALLYPTYNSHNNTTYGFAYAADTSGAPYIENSGSFTFSGGVGVTYTLSGGAYNSVEYHYKDHDVTQVAYPWAVHKPFSMTTKTSIGLQTSAAFTFNGAIQSDCSITPTGGIVGISYNLSSKTTTVSVSYDRTQFIVCTATFASLLAYRNPQSLLTISTNYGDQENCYFAIQNVSNQPLYISMPTITYTGDSSGSLSARTLTLAAGSSTSWSIAGNNETLSFAAAQPWGLSPISHDSSYYYVSMISGGHPSLQTMWNSLGDQSKNKK